MKKCFYCSEMIDIQSDDFEKVGKKYICMFCREDYADEIDGTYDEEDADDTKSDESDY
tara:strand:- start:1172 stop:1345 length:174 start_codon:yes stop_codon:yes gene_type:complete